MKLPKNITLKKISSIIKAEVNDNPDQIIYGINEIHKIEEGDLTFVDNDKYYNKALQSKSSVVIIDKAVENTNGKILIISDDPFRDYNILVNHFSPYKNSNKNISDTATIGKDTIIQPNVFIGNDVKIGKNCLIHPHVSIYDNCIICDNVIIHANTVIGADAFYYKSREEQTVKYDKLYSCGRTIIEDFVEIGANCCIDRGVSGDTIIGRGTKIDNLVHIGHGTVIGKNCLFAAQVGIGGKAIIEDNVIMWGQVGISKDLTIGKNAVILSQSGVSKSLPGNKVYFGSPAAEAQKKWRELATLRKLPDIWKKMK